MVMAGAVGCTVVVGVKGAYDFSQGLHQATLVGIALSLALILFCIALARRYPLLFFEFVVAIASAAWVAASVFTYGVDGIVWAFASIGASLLIAPSRHSGFFALCILATAIAALHRVMGSDISIALVVELVAFTALIHLYKLSMSSQREAVENKRVRLDLLLRCSDAGSLEWDGGTDRAHYSPRLREMLGLSADVDTARVDFWSYLPPGFRERVKQVFLRQIGAVTAPYESTPPLWMEYPIVRADKSRIWVHARAIRISGADGRFARYVCTFVDITERLEVERQLRLANVRVEGQTQKLTHQRAALERALQAREEVEHVARHDLKTPLAQIVSITDTLRHGPAPAETNDALLATLEATARRAMRMLKLAIDFYPIEEGRFEFVPEPVDLAGVVRNVCETFRTHADTKQLSFVLDFSRGPFRAEGDLVLCETIVENLVKNAIEAAPEGSRITIALHNGPRVWLSIHNEGMVPPEVQSTFFQKYSTAGKAGGTGLGTYSARLMARAQRGELRMSTSQEDGTRLVLELGAVSDECERPAAQERQDAVPSKAAASEWDILVVDDDAYSSLAIAGIADSHGIVRTAPNGRAALESVMANRPDVIFMDLEMPVMGGLETVGLVRSFQAKAAQRPSVVIALSAHDDPQTMRQARASGFDRCEGKPITRDRMARVLDAVAAALEDAR